MANKNDVAKNTMRRALIILVLIYCQGVYADMFNSPWKQESNGDVQQYIFAGGGVLTYSQSFDNETGNMINQYIFTTSPAPSDVSDFYGSGMPFGEPSSDSGAVVQLPSGYTWQQIESAASIRIDEHVEHHDSELEEPVESEEAVNVNVEFPDEMTVTGKVEIDIPDQLQPTHNLENQELIEQNQYNYDRPDLAQGNYSSTYVIWRNGSNSEMFNGAQSSGFSHYNFVTPEIDWEQFKQDLQTALFGANRGDEFEVKGLNSFAITAKQEIEDINFTINCPFGGSFSSWDVNLPLNQWAESSIVGVLRAVMALIVYVETGLMISNILLKRT